jgi:DNA-binding GntR family transcriptional regulator
MSRTPIREALQRLEDDGLVVTTPARRTFVSPVTLAQAREIFPVVADLEALAIRLGAAPMPRSALDAMRATNERLAAALAEGDAWAALEADTTLHDGVVAHAGNAELASVLAELKSKVRRIEHVFWGGADRTASLTDHDELIAALHADDRERAQTVLARNWERGLRWLSPERA